MRTPKAGENKTCTEIKVEIQEGAGFTCLSAKLLGIGGGGWGICAVVGYFVERSSMERCWEVPQ